MKHILTFIKDGERKTYTKSIKKLCVAEGLPYWTIRRIKFPIHWNGIIILKEEVL